MSWIMAAVYDRVMAKAEAACLTEWRATLLAQTHGTVLELGSGTGAITEWPLAHAARVVAMDASPRMLARARARHKEPVSLVEHDADRISLSRQAFSAVFGYAKHLLGSKGVLVLKMP